MNVSKSFTEFSFSDLNLDEQTFEDYKSRYLDIYDKTRPKPDKEKESMLEEVDFELELIHRDEINVTYILELLGKLQRDNDATQEDYQNQKAYILEIIFSICGMWDTNKSVLLFMMHDVSLVCKGCELNKVQK